MNLNLLSNLLSAFSIYFLIYYTQKKAPYPHGLGATLTFLLKEYVLLTYIFPMYSSMSSRL